MSFFCQPNLLAFLSKGDSNFLKYKLLIRDTDQISEFEIVIHNSRFSLSPKINLNEAACYITDYVVEHYCSIVYLNVRKKP